MSPAQRSSMPTLRRYIPLVLIGLVSACINVPEIEPATDSGTPTNTQPDAGDPGAGDAGAVDVPDSGTQPSGLTVTITAPTGPLYTSGSASISVDVRGGTPELVQLFKDEVELATLSSPYAYTWNTTTETEGNYKITARATKSGRTFTSAPVTIIVDRANLRVSSRSPTPGSTNVDYSTPIQVVFTKAVKAATVSDATVGFAVSGVLAEKTLSLSSDGKTLTITPKARPPLPATFSVSLSSSITDLAGNALVGPGTPWSFELPNWYAFGGPLNAVGGRTLLKDTAMVLDSQSNPVVAWSEELATGGRTSIFVYRWDGNAFTPLGTPLNSTPSGSAYKPALALDGNGNPVVAWQESDGFNENIYVKRWNGSTWQSIGTGGLSAVDDTRPNPTPTPARNPSLAVHGNEIYVAWDEVSIDEITVIHVQKSVDGGAFVGVGPNGGMINAVYDFTNGSKPSLVLDSNGQPIVAFHEQTLNESHIANIYVMRFQPNGSWAYAVPPFYGNDTTGYVSGGLSASSGDTPAKDCSLSIDAQNNLYLAWSEETLINGPQDIQVYRSTGPQSWERIGSPLSAFDGFSFAIQPRIQVTPSGKLFVTWIEFDGTIESTHQNLFASHWDNQTWNTLTTQDGINEGQNINIHPMLAIDFSGRPVIAWHNGHVIGGDFAGDYLYVRRYNN
ncbi:Ig-like domain-containing protein [Archangium violaceum]|uniref:Ig-like domain-containing protein n=1 Tax=Archangium violaceum TaxID=83451 RepID=UPI00194EFE32|nr:Ig-like domain-containing protein [Archangium violaceum]QRO00992.1 Ig-like domain-containing protein [Archangium violaceum]